MACGKDSFLENERKNIEKTVVMIEYLTEKKAINLLTDNDPIEDDSIVIENINAVYTFGGITATLFKNTNEVLVLILKRRL